MALGWLTAPRTGARARGLARQRLQHWGRIGRNGLYRAGRGALSRITGAMTGGWMRLRYRRGTPRYVDANTLVDQVHSLLGRQFPHLREHVNLNAADHTIYLHGHVSSRRERDELVEAIAAVAGVGRVRCEMLRIVAPGHRPGHAA